MSSRSVVFLYHIPKTAGQSIRHALCDALGLAEGFVQVGPFGDKRSVLAGRPTFLERDPADLSRARVAAGHYLRADMAGRFPGATIREAIVLREPVARLVSQYNHAMFTRTQRCGMPLQEFDDWYVEEAARTLPWERIAGRQLEPDDVRTSLVSVGRNYMAKFVLHANGERDYADLDDSTLYERARAVLDRFAHVGAVEAIEHTVRFLSCELGFELDVQRRNRGSKRRAPAITASPELIERLCAENEVDVRLYDRCRERLA
jgi:hypothetical protein